ncbi:MAG: DUF5808 domain-containing protein [Bacteroidales bacterium]
MNIKMNLLGLAIIIFCCVFSGFNLSGIPDTIPIHWNHLSNVDSMGSKLWIFSGIILSFLLYIFMGLIFKYGLSPRIIKSENVSHSSNKRKPLDKIQFFLGLVTIFIMSIPLTYPVSIVIFYPTSNPFPFILISSVVFLIISLIFLVKAVQHIAKYLGEGYPSFMNAIVNFIGFYDPNNPRVFVEKKIGTGTTVNFATRGGKWFFIICILLPILFIIFALFTLI